MRIYEHHDLLTRYAFSPRTWQSKRMIYTRTTIFFCRLAGSEVMDMIPLDEVAKVLDSESTQEQIEDDPKVPTTPGSSNIMRIETIPDGYNSARTYHIQVTSPYVCFVEPNHPSYNVTADQARRGTTKGKRKLGSIVKTRKGHGDHEDPLQAASAAGPERFFIGHLPNLPRPLDFRGIFASDLLNKGFIFVILVVDQYLYIRRACSCAPYVPIQ